MSNYKPFGEIMETFQDDNGAVFEWKLPVLDFLSLHHLVQFYESSPFHFVDTTWRFRIYPHNRYQGEDCVGFEFFRTNNSKPLRFSLEIRTTDGRLERTIPVEKFPRKKNYWSQQGFLLWSDILGLPNLSERLIIACRLWKEKPSNWEENAFFSSESQTRMNALGASGKQEPHENLDVKGVITLQNHLKDLLLSGDDHDIVIKIKNREFKAHKCMLRARSPVFAAMFRHKMKESIDDCISIDDCEPEAFSEFLQYVYTSKVENWSPDNAMGLYYVGDKYDFPRLKEMSVEFLKTSLSAVVISDVISFAVRHKEEELLDYAVAFFSQHMEEIMVTVEWQRFIQENPIQANELCLKALKSAYRKIK